MQRGIVGRRSELEAFASQVAARAEGELAGEPLYVVGAPGIGKSRLVRQAVVVAGLPSLWIDLTCAASLADVTDALARAAGAAGPETIAACLSALGPSLVVLDGLDAMTPDTRDAIHAWAEAAPEAIVVVTSRQRPSAGSSVEIGPLDEAPELFDAVARSVGAEPRPEDAPFVLAIVDELGRVPLAIELAAARSRVLGPRALLHRLKSRFDLLKKSRARPEDGRHASLEACLEASWETLDAPEQTALAEAAVFAGGFTAAAAEAVLDLSVHPGAPPVVDVLEALTDKCLLVRRPSRVAGEVRLGLDASLRAFAWQKLDAARAVAVADRHAAHFAGAATAWAAALETDDAEASRLRILDDEENVLVVARRTLGKGTVGTRTAELALQTLVALAPVLLASGPIESYAALLEPVLHATRNSGADPRLVARVLLVSGLTARLRGNARAGAADLVRALSVAQASGDRHVEARALAEIGAALRARGDLAGAEEHQARALAIASASGDRGLEGNVARSLGLVMAERGRVTEGALVVRRAEALHTAIRAERALADDHLALAWVALETGDVSGARGHVAEARRRGASGVAAAARILGFAAHDEGDLAEAERCFVEAEADVERHGARVDPWIAIGRGGVARERGRAADAWTFFRAAAVRTDEEPRGAALAAAHLVALEAAAGRKDDAHAFVERAAAMVVESGDPVAAALVAHARSGAAIDPALAARSVGLRLLVRCQGVADRPEVRLPSLEETLLVGEGGQWFRMPGAERVSLERRPPLARMLDRLVTERLARPEGALSSEALQQASWPGERILPAAGAHRVRVAIATLRKLGLAAAIETSPAGYRLASRVPCARV